MELLFRFSLSAGMVSKVKEFNGDRDVLYSQVLNHVVNLAQRTGKLISLYYLFFSWMLFHQSLFSALWLNDSKTFVYYQTNYLYHLEFSTQRPPTSITNTILIVNEFKWFYDNSLSHYIPIRAVSTIGILFVLAACGWILRVLGGMGVDGNCGKLTFGRPELEWFLAHFVPVGVVMGLVSLLVNIVTAFYCTLRSTSKSRLLIITLC
jgi:hypothetical protein